MARIEKRGALVIKQKKVIKHILPNGLTVLVHQNKIVPKVSTQLWYHVGSKDEKTGEKGMAHLIEHMIFKGTKKLSESDINVITNKLSGYCNAFTSYDYTGYLFDFPSQHWQYALEMMSDCMRNCTFREDLLASELKAVIQELKMYKDNHVMDLVEKMTCTAFQGHPYENPIIGYKHDLWSLQQQTLVNFYKKHYVPNNATLVVVGDVEGDQVVKLAEKYFGDIAADKNYKREEFNLPKDIVAKSVTIYRDIQQPTMLIGYNIPGANDRQDYLIDVVSWVLGSGRGSRLRKKLVDELHLVTDVETFAYDLFDAGQFFIEVQLVNQDDKQKVLDLIDAELDDLVQNGPTEKELLRAQKKIETDYLALLESNQKQAYALGKSFLATGDENYLFNYVDAGEQDLAQAVQNFVVEYLRPTVRQLGQVEKLPESEKNHWLKLQAISDKEDKKILGNRVRETEVEPAVYANEISAGNWPKFDFPKYELMQLSNGLEVVFYNEPSLPKIELLLDLKADSLYDSWDKQGVSNFVSNMMTEGTQKYDVQQLADEIEGLGMSLGVASGYVAMNMLSKDFAKGLEILHEVLTAPTFTDKAIEKVRTIIQSDIKHYWDDPSQFMDQIVRNNMYKDHPYSKSVLGTKESVASITRDDLVASFKKYISPRGARLAVVGDIENCDLKQILEDSLGSWQGDGVADLEYPTLDAIAKQEVKHKINRDQVVLSFAGRSVKRTDSDFDKLLLFEQIFSGGVLGSMSSQLFQLREQSGLFYTINGSLTSKSGEQPGLAQVRTIVSLDRLGEAEKQIKDAIDCATSKIAPGQLEESVNALASATIDNFASARKIARAFLFLRKYDLAPDYFDGRAKVLAAIEQDEIVETVNKYLSTDKMITFKIGRV